VVSWREYAQAIVDLDGSTTRTVAIFAAPFAGAICDAAYTQEKDADGDKTVKLRNLTKGVDITQELDVDALGANGSSTFTIIRAAAEFEELDVVGLVYTVNTAGTVNPEQISISMDLERLDSE